MSIPSDKEIEKVIERLMKLRLKNEIKQINTVKEITKKERGSRNNIILYNSIITKKNRMGIKLSRSKNDNKKNKRYCRWIWNSNVENENRKWNRSIKTSRKNTKKNYEKILKIRTTNKRIRI